MKARLLIFHDINGLDQTFLSSYENLLRHHFEIVFYDLDKLGGIAPSEDRHSQYIKFGIRSIVENILKLEEKIHTPRYLLGFSVGATIAYDLALQGLSFKYLLGLSGTRIRKYRQVPFGNIELVYGAQDDFRPTEEWLSEKKINHELLENTSHDFYKESSMIKHFTNRFIQNYEIISQS